MSNGITSTGNGWHHTTVTCTSAATGITRVMAITWRSTRGECRGCSTKGETWANRAPAYCDGSFGTLRGVVTQCSGCGCMTSAPTWTYAEVTA